MGHYNGAAVAATGTITSNTASLLSFPDAKKDVIINNRSGQTAYLKINDAATPTVSTSAYHLCLSDGQIVAIEDAEITNISVYVTATSGIVINGWD
jgi:hypothetical protein